MRHVAMVLVCVLLGSTLSIDASGPADERRRVRPTQKLGWKLLEQGRTQSPTFRRLVDRLEQSDVIVYVELLPSMSHSLSGTLRFVTTTERDRYLHIALNPQHSVNTLVAMLGHELQHAVEVADARDVTSPEGLRHLYTRIGVRITRDSYDSRAAQQAGEDVRAEMRLGRDSGLRVARGSRSDAEVLPTGGSIAVAP